MAKPTQVRQRGVGVSRIAVGTLKTVASFPGLQVQAGCIPAILAGRDVLGTAQTGSGKTAAFALPILQKLAEEPYGVFALVLTPTRSSGQCAVPWISTFKDTCRCMPRI